MPERQSDSGQSDVDILDEIDNGSGTDNPAKVVLFNDANHGIKEVIEQIKKATGFGHDKAEAITMEAHTKGRAIVIDGAVDKCLKVSGVLQEIGLQTQIEF